VGIATGYGLNDSAVGVQVAAEKRFYIFLDVQSDSGDYKIFCPMCTTVSMSGFRWPGGEADHSPRDSAKMKGT
jgi:hypothetical protein